MEPLQFVRLIRRRWVVLMLCMALAAAGGYASTLRDGEVTGPVQSYWASGEILVADAAEARNLNTIAPFVTGGTVPGAVAERIGVPPEEFLPTIWTVVNAQQATFQISVVALDAEVARDRVQLLATELRNQQEAESQIEFAEDRELLQSTVDRHQARLVELDADIREVELRIAADTAVPQSDVDSGVPGEPNADDVRELEGLEALRTVELSRLADALNSLETFDEVGPPGSPLRPLEPIPPFQISERAYTNQINAGQQGPQNRTAGVAGLIEPGSTGLGEEGRFDQPQVRAIAGAIAGFLIGLLAILIHWRLDPRLRNRDEAEAAFGLPVITEVPLMGRRDIRKKVLHSRDRPRSIVSEAHRYLRSVLLYSRATGDAASDVDEPGAHSAARAEAEREVRVVMVTSAGSGEGKSTTSANLAVVMAEAGYKTLLFNCDHRLPSVHQLLKCDYVPAKTQRVPDVPNLTFIADVKRIEGESPAEIARRQVKVLERARKTFDVIIIDTAPLMATNDAIDLLGSTDLVVMVAREAKTTSSAAEETREIIDRIGTPIAGIVVTCSGAGLGARYYDSYRYGSYYGSKSSKTVRRAKTPDAGAQPVPANPPGAQPNPVPPEELAQFDVGSLHVNGNGNGHANGHAPVNGSAPYVPRNGHVHPTPQGPEIDVRGQHHESVWEQQERLARGADDQPRH